MMIDDDGYGGGGDVDEANLKAQYMTQGTAAQNIKKQVKSSIENEKIEELKRKTTHGQFCQDLERPSVHKEKSLAWLCGSGLKGEMESLIIAAEDKCSMHIMVRGTS